jgi:hypothetical protein
MLREGKSVFFFAALLEKDSQKSIVKDPCTV